MPKRVKVEMINPHLFRVVGPDGNIVALFSHAIDAYQHANWIGGEVEIDGKVASLLVA